MRSTQWTTQQITDEITRTIAEELGILPTAVKPDVDIESDLGADSLSQLEIVMRVEEVFDLEIPDEDTEHLRTLRQVCEYLERRLKE